ncbi:N-acetylglucosamine kinase [Calothrix sp. PCC 6303]|uniref:N-acetylglucosamine kinase n=1 Tax=Calothrix sp. PCC 6303 TaxID=1170562 RepID=UPI0002A02A8F|nr:BadF/BadG/BcrA/BcrD ATPase family protein [Calothrix sp. PCC 6303]AFZ02656.1 ATPase BadF/BadG/BcrA/BcrD type [Calothrix sp. PCC 6303]
MEYILGIDGGGSKTVCVLMDIQGKIWGRGEAGASNYQTIGVSATFQSIEAAIFSATAEALGKIEHRINNLSDKIKVTAICLGLAGVARIQDREVVESIVADLQISLNFCVEWELDLRRKIIICHDALIALVGGIGNDIGIVVAAGTGSIIFGINQQGITKRVGGWGYLLGDEGSAYKIAVTGLQMAMQFYDGRGKATSLLKGFQSYLKLQNMEDSVEVVYRSGWGVKEIAGLAIIVDNAAVEGDEIANQIIDEAVRELVKATSVVIDALGFSLHSQVNKQESNDIFEIVTVGSVWQSKSRMRERFIQSVTTIYPNAKIILPRFEPAYGAALLGLKRLNELG